VPEGAFVWGGFVDGKAISTTCAALTQLVRNRELSQVLLNSINLGGDVDSVAAIALGLASLATDTIRDLPKHLYFQLENKAYGREYLQQLDAQLFASGKLRKQPVLPYYAQDPA
jgi:ADP-ribosylglycohydrolase